VRVRVEHEALEEALKIVGPAVGRRGGLAVLAGVHVDASDAGLVLTATDLDLTVEASVAGGIDETGAVVASASLLTGFVHAAPGEVVTLELRGPELVATSGDASMALPTYPTQDWPKVEHAGGSPLALDTDTLAAAARVAFAADADPKHVAGIHRGVWFDQGHAVATDKYRLAAAELAGEIPAGVIPAEVLKMVAKVSPEGVELTIDRFRATFGAGEVSWTTRLIEGEIPPWKKLFAEKAAPYSIEADAKVLLDALDRSALIRSGGRPRVKFKLEGDKLALWAREMDVGEISEQLLATGECPIEVCVDVGFLADAVEAANTERVRLEITDSMKPILLRSEGMSQLVMPVRAS
jgi:DNA polymerase-3 subunit beta